MSTPHPTPADPVRRYFEHARRYGIEGVLETAAEELGEHQLERLRGQLLDKLGIRSKRPQTTPPPQPESVTKTRNRPIVHPTPERVQTGRPVQIESGRKCAICGKGLGGRHSHAKTCSTRCRVALHRAGGN